MNCKPLVCFANAYDCKEAIESFDNLPCDKLRMDYLHYPFQFIEARDFFLKNKQYTHFVYLAPDLIISPEEFEELKKGVKENSVYGAVCNVDQRKYKKHLAICQKLPSIKYSERHYRFLPMEAALYLIDHNVKELKVKFNGLTFCFIRREIIEKHDFTKLPFDSDEPSIWDDLGGWACDLAFAHHCDFNNIDILVNLEIKLNHLRYPGKLQVGVKKPLITFIPFLNHGVQNI